MILLALTNSVFGSNTHVLRYHANVINTFLSADSHFPDSEAYERQSLALIEEVGECVGAGRRFLGMARRNGTVEDFGAELADVVITTHVFANMLSVQLYTNVGAFPIERQADTRLATAQLLIEMSRALVSVLDTNEGLHMDSLIRLAQATADMVGIGLPAVVNAKLEIIYARGWKDGEPNANPDQLALFNTNSK